MQQADGERPAENGKAACPPTSARPEESREHERHAPEDGEFDGWSQHDSWQQEPAAQCRDDREKAPESQPLQHANQAAVLETRKMPSMMIEIPTSLPHCACSPSHNQPAKNART